MTLQLLSIERHIVSLLVIVPGDVDVKVGVVLAVSVVALVLALETANISPLDTARETPPPPSRGV